MQQEEARVVRDLELAKEPNAIGMYSETLHSSPLLSHRIYDFTDMSSHYRKVVKDSVQGVSK